VRPRSRWDQVRARFLFREVNERGFDLPLASVTAGGGVEFRDDLAISVWNPGSDTSLYKRVRPGDFVIGLRSFQSGIGHSGIEGLVSPAYTVLRPVHQGVDQRFYRHYFKSDRLISQLENVAQGIRQGRTIGTEDFYDLWLPLPSQAEQQTIADFLDREIARIDALITKKEELRQRLVERFKTLVMDEIFGPKDEPWVPLRRLVELLPGYSFSSDDMTPISDGNVRLLRGINIAPGSVRWDDTVYVSPDIASTIRRFELRSGDIVIGMDRPVIAGGMRVARLESFDCPSLLVQRVARIRPRRGVDPQFVQYALESEAFVEYFSPITTGVSVPHISPEQILAFRLPARTTEEQASIAKRLTAVARNIRQLDGRLGKQMQLLHEHRQALITSAVTGQMEIPSAAA
jgi:type I restriction enzyme, S subunit